MRTILFPSISEHHPMKLSQEWVTCTNDIRAVFLSCIVLEQEIHLLFGLTVFALRIRDGGTYDES